MEVPIFLNPLGLLALLSIPCIVWLHLYRQRPKTRKVSSLLLWTSVRPTNIAGPKKEPLLRSLSFYLEIVGAILLSILFAQPKSCLQTQEHHIYVLDTSASMMAQDKHLAVMDSLISDLQSLGTNHRVTIIEAGAQPAVIAGPYSGIYDALETLKKVDFIDPYSNIQEAIDIADHIALGKVSVWTDSIPETEIDAHIEWHAIGESLPNIGFYQATIHRNQLILKIGNASDTEAKAKMTLRINQQSQEEDITIPANNILNKEYHLPSNFKDLEAQLHPLQKDGLEADNYAYLSANPNRTIQLATELPEDISRKLGLYHINQEAAIERLGFQIQWSSPLQADLLFTDRTLGGGPNTWRVSILMDEEKHSLSNTLFTNKQHSLLYNVQMGNVLWAFDPSRELEGLPLIEINGQSVLSEVVQNNAARRIYNLNWHPLYSNWSQQPSWAIFLSTLLQQRNLQIPGLLQSNVNSNEDIHIIDAMSGDWTLQYQHKKHLLQHHEGDLNISPLGLGKNILINPNNSEIISIGVNLNSPTESDLRQAAQVHIPSQKDWEVIQERSQWLNILVLIAAIMIWMWDWHITGRPS